MIQVSNQIVHCFFIHMFEVYSHCYGRAILFLLLLGGIVPVFAYAKSPTVWQSTKDISPR
jgi:hypothetical protein